LGFKNFDKNNQKYATAHNFHDPSHVSRSIAIFAGEKLLQIISFMKGKGFVFFVIL
jgi:hypothetical protein